jgi:hypothetical protein
LTSSLYLLDGRGRSSLVRSITSSSSSSSLSG